MARLVDDERRAMAVLVVRVLRLGQEEALVVQKDDDRVVPERGLVAIGVADAPALQPVDQRAHAEVEERYARELSEGERFARRRGGIRRPRVVHRREYLGYAAAEMRNVGRVPDEERLREAQVATPVVVLRDEVDLDPPEDLPDCCNDAR